MAGVWFFCGFFVTASPWDLRGGFRRKGDRNSRTSYGAFSAVGAACPQTDSPHTVGGEGNFGGGQ